MDSGGNVYVVDVRNNRIQKFDSTAISSPNGAPIVSAMDSLICRKR